MAILTGTAAEAKRLWASVERSERLEPVIASRRGERPQPASSVWVSPTGAISSGAYPGEFQRRNGTSWESTDEDCLIRDANGGTLVVGKRYLGRITDSDTDGVPIVDVLRGAIASSGECGRSWLRLPDCGTLTTTEQEGAAACVPTQTAALTKDTDGNLTSDTLLYGCPPGVLTAICDGSITTGAPRKWNVVVAGFTGGSTGFNGSYTLTWSAGETWIGTRSGITVTAVRDIGGWSLVLTDGVTTVNYDTASGVCCASFDLDLTGGGGSTTPPATLTMVPATSCGKGPAYTPVLSRTVSDCGICLNLVWEPEAGSGARNIEFRLVECGTDADGNSYIDFATDDPLLCTGTETECGVNSFVCRITCAVCDDTVEISCCDDPMPRELCVKLSSFTGMLSGLADTTVLVPYDSFNGYYRSGLALYYTSSCDGTHDGFLTFITITPCGGSAGARFWDVELTGAWNASSTTFGDNSNTHADGACSLPISGTATGPIETMPGCTATFGYAISDPADGCDPPPITYNCVDGTCVAVYDGSGQSYADCLVTCSAIGGPGCLGCGLIGLAPSLVIADGPNAGTYTGSAWATGGNPAETTFTVGGDTYTVYCDSTGQAYLSNGAATTGGVADCGPPTVMTFSGAMFGASGSCTVTT